MTNLHEPDGRSGIGEPAASLEADLTTLYSVPVPDLRLDLCALPAFTGTAPGGRRFILRHWRPVMTLAVAAAAIAVFVAGPSIWGSDTTHVSAEEILQRTNAAAEGNAPVTGAPRYHLVASTEASGMTCRGSVQEDGASSGSVSTDGTNVTAEGTDGDSVTCEASATASSSTEIWFSDSEHFRNSDTFSSPSGGGPSTFGQAVNGAEAWLYMSDEQGLRVVHGPAGVLGMMSGLGQPDTKSLADVLGQYSRDGCQSARVTGEEAVAGRTAYVIEVRQTPDSCGLGEGGTIVKRLPAGADAGTMTAWVDRETFLPLKAERRDGGGTLTYSYHVTEIQVGGDIPASAFEYTPPAGAEVTDVTTAMDAKDALAGVGFGASSGGASGDPTSGTSEAAPVTPVAR